MRKLTGLAAALLVWIGCTGVAAGFCANGPPLPPDGLQWPLAGELTTGWSLDCETGRGHRGVDISAAPGTPVEAAAPGRVIFAGYTPAEGGGMTISIEHAGGLRSTYLHILDPEVSQDDEITGGQTIGFVGEQPLHFGLKLPGDRDTYFNPLELIGPMVPEANLPSTSATASTVPHAEPASTAAPAPAAAAADQSASSESVAVTVLPESLLQTGAAGITVSAPLAQAERLLLASPSLVASPSTATPSLIQAPAFGLFISGSPQPAGSIPVVAEGLLPQAAGSGAPSLDLTVTGGGGGQRLMTGLTDSRQTPATKASLPGGSTEQSERGSALPAAVFTVLMVGASIAVRRATPWSRIPEPVSAQPTGPW